MCCGTCRGTRHTWMMAPSPQAMHWMHQLVPSALLRLVSRARMEVLSLDTWRWVLCLPPTLPPPPPPLCAPVLGVTRLLLHQQCHTPVYAVCTCCCSWQQYAMLLLSGERVQRVSSRTCECGMMMIPQRALFMYTLYMDRKSCLTPLPAPAAAPSAPQKSTSNQERSDVRSSACSSKPPPFRMSDFFKSIENLFSFSQYRVSFIPYPS